MKMQTAFYFIMFPISLPNICTNMFNIFIANEGL